jgi:hypothetical protein
MGHFSVEIMRLPGQLSVEINREQTGGRAKGRPGPNSEYHGEKHLRPQTGAHPQPQLCTLGNQKPGACDCRGCHGLAGCPGNKRHAISFGPWREARQQSAFYRLRPFMIGAGIVCSGLASTIAGRSGRGQGCDCALFSSGQREQQQAAKRRIGDTDG